MAFWSRKGKDDMAKKKTDDKAVPAEKASAVEKKVAAASAPPVVAPPVVAPAPVVAPVVAPAPVVVTPAAKSTKAVLAELVAELSAHADACRQSAAGQQGTGAYVANVQADTYQTAVEMVKGKM